MADAASVTDDQKRALLTAVAQQGTAGAQAYQQYSDSVQAQRAEAVAAAQKRSSLINAGPAADKALTGSAVATSDPYAQDAATGATAYANENARLGQANSDYMDQVKAAIPLMAAKANAAVAKKAAAKKEAADADNPFAQLIKSLGGEGLAKAQLAPALKQGVEDLQGGYDPIGAAMSTGKGEVNEGKTPEWVHQQDYNRRAIDTLGQALGVGPGVLQSFLGKQSPDTYTPPKAAPKTPLSVQNKAKVDKIHRDPAYNKIYANISAEYAELTDRNNKHRISSEAARQKIKAEARNDHRYSKYQDIFDQAIRDL